MSLIENITEINEVEFEEKVIKASSSNLILVDFWAPWCGPCKQLTPNLEKIINNSNDKVKLVKINIDENQQIATKLRIQSIPAVFAFKDGQPIDAFQGVLPEKKIIEFIEKSLGEKLIEDFTEFYKSISILFSENNFDKAKDNLEQFLAENTKEFKGIAMYIDCLSALNLFNDVDSFVESLNEDALNNSFIKSSIQKLTMKKETLQGPSINKLIEDLKKEPKNLDFIIKLADKYFIENMVDDAFNLLLKNYPINKEKIRNKFLKFFETLGNDNPKTSEFRKKLSSLIFS